MKRLTSGFSVLAAVAVMTGSTFVSAQDESTLSRLADYRHWTKINSEPVKVETQVSPEAVEVSGMSAPV
jgi:hypothetical protein